MTDQPKILLVEDEENIALALKFLIERKGYDIAHAATGEDALASLEARPPDLVVLDAMLPGISGFGVCQHIRETETLRDTKVLIISAAGEGARRKALAIGADAFFLKPFDTSALTDTIADLLRPAPAHA